MLLSTASRGANLRLAKIMEKPALFFFNEKITLEEEPNSAEIRASCLVYPNLTKTATPKLGLGSVKIKPEPWFKEALNGHQWDDLLLVGCELGRGAFQRHLVEEKKVVLFANNCNRMRATKN